MSQNTSEAKGNHVGFFWHISSRIILPIAKMKLCAECRSILLGTCAALRRFVNLGTNPKAPRVTGGNHVLKSMLLVSRSDFRMGLMQTHHRLRSRVKGVFAFARSECTYFTLCTRDGGLRGRGRHVYEQSSKHRREIA